MEYSNVFGKLTIEFDKEPAAGNYVEFRMTFSPSSGFEMVPRTSLEFIQFTRFFSNQWSLPQVFDPTAPGYVKAKRSDGGFVDVSIKRVPAVYFRHGSTFHAIQITIGETPLENEGKIEIIYGYKGGGSVGVKTPPLAKSYFFPVFISMRHVQGSKLFLEEKSVPFDDLFAFNQNVSYDLVKEKASFCPEVFVKEGEASKIKLIATAKDKAIKFSVSILDSFGNICKGIDTKAIVNEKYNISVSKGYGKAEVSIVASGIERFRCECGELGLYGISNPVSNAYKVAFGEIHSHSSISDGLGTDKDNYTSAINAGLDFGALSDHDTLLEKDDSLWQKTVENAERYNDENDFVTLLGYEALTYIEGETAGHMNLYYPGSTGKMIPRPNLCEIPNLCKTHGAIAIPHHTMYGGQFFGQMGLRLDLMEPSEFSSDIMPVVEIYSTHGCSETVGCDKSVLGVNPESSVMTALEKGFKWGFIGGSDNHESLLGSNFRVDKMPRTINNEHMQFRHGLTAVYIKKLNRKNLFNAIKNRSVYATTGERILLYFEINGIPMGQEISVNSAKEPRNIKIVASGTGVIDTMDIIKNGKTLTRRTPRSPDIEVFFVDEDALEGSTYYYVKVVQVDGEMAWSSPVWINFS